MNRYAEYVEEFNRLITLHSKNVAGLTGVSAVSHNAHSQTIEFILSLPAHEMYKDHHRLYKTSVASLTMKKIPIIFNKMLVALKTAQQDEA